MSGLKIGVIGTGRMGLSHIERLQHRIAGATVYAVASHNTKNAQAAAEEYNIPVVCSAEEMTETGVDAVIVASPGDSHEKYVQHLIEMRMPVFCEKPLADTRDGCAKLMQSESECGKQLVQVGFMRRFDPYHNEIRTALLNKALGAPLLVHAVHRTPSTASGFDNRMEIMDAAIHEIDILPWLLGDDTFISCSVIHGRSAVSASKELCDPQLLVFETVSGVIVNLEIFTNCSYGFDINCEVVCEKGTISLPQSVSTVVKAASHRQILEYDKWDMRYKEAFDKELQHFISAVRMGAVSGPSAWDAYKAAEVGETCMIAQETAAKQAIKYLERPPLYKSRINGL